MFVDVFLRDPGERGDVELLHTCRTHSSDCAEVRRERQPRSFVVCVTTYIPLVFIFAVELRLEACRGKRCRFYVSSDNYQPLGVAWLLSERRALAMLL